MTSSTAGPPSSSPVPPMSTQKLGPILEMALLKAPALNLKAGNNMTAINRFRAMLQAEESESTKVKICTISIFGGQLDSNFLTQEIRRNVCTKLAEVLLRTSDVKYTRPETDLSPKHHHRPSMLSSVSDSPWKPRRHAGPNLYTPKNKEEEVVLLLMLSEYMARKEAILSQAPEFFGMRSTKFRDAIIAYDLTAVALSRVRNFRVLAEMLQHSMKFSFNEPHTWTQFGLALATEGKYLRYSVLHD